MRDILFWWTGAVVWWAATMSPFVIAGLLILAGISAVVRVRRAWRRAGRPRWTLRKALWVLWYAYGYPPSGDRWLVKNAERFMADREAAARAARPSRPHP